MASSFGFVLIGIVVWASVTSSTHTGLPPPGSESEGSSFLDKKTNTGECITNADCPLNHFCEGRGERKRCAVCMNCSELYERKAKKSYDGESCATHQSECGECNDGYEEMGGICAPKVTSTTTITSIHADKHEVFGKKEESLEAGISTWPWLVILIGAFVGLSAVCLIFMLTRKMQCLRKLNGGNRNEEEAGLTSYNNGSYDAPTATAPLPEEYNIQPKAYVPGWPWTDSSNKAHHVRMAEATVERAQPFNNGYAATDGRDYLGEYANDPASIPDAVDGAAASTPTEEGPPPANNGIHGGNVNNNGGPTNNVRTNQNNTLGRQRQFFAATGQMGNMEANLPPLPQSNQPPRPFGNVSRGQNQQNPANNDVLAQFHFVAELGVVFRYGPLAAGTPNDSAAQPSGGARTITSAPVSPRRIDDTHVDGILQLQEPFQQSNVSIDSGTGVSDHERSVPSRSGSASGGLSELDDSMFGDDFGSLQAPEAQEVPQHEAEVQFYHEEPMFYD